ncbi:MAG: flippase [Parcubacteria group bacterium]|jgi:O-antigen/teichoic acid export membrane protein
MIAQKISYNIIFNVITKVISIALALFAIGMLARYLGTEGFGKYTTMLAFFAFFSAIGDFGLYPIATRDISRDGADESWIMSRVFTLRMIISCVIFLLSTFFVWFLPYTTDVKTSILIACAAFIFSSGYGLLNGVFQKHIAMDRVALVELSGKIIQVFTIVLVLTLHLRFTAVAISLLATMFWNFIILFFVTRSYVTISFIPDSVYWKKFLKESAPMGISAIITFLYFKFDAIMLSFMQSQSDVGIYGAAYKIIETLIFFPAMIVGLIFPLLSRYIISDILIFNKITTIIIKLFTIILIPLVICTVYLAPEIIAIVGGPDFHDAAPVLQILIFALACVFFGQLFTNILIAGAHQKVLMYALFFAALLNIVANGIFIYLYSYTGAAIVSVITEFFVAFVAIIMTKRLTPFVCGDIRLPFIILSGELMAILLFFLPLPHVFSTCIAIVVYLFLLFFFRIVTHNDIMHILPKRS